MCPHTAVYVQGRAQLKRVPALVMPVCEAGQLPGGLHYCALHASPALYPLGTRAENMSRDLHTETMTPMSYTRLEIDKYGRTASLSCVSDRHIPNGPQFTCFTSTKVQILTRVWQPGT